MIGPDLHVPDGSDVCKQYASDKLEITYCKSLYPLDASLQTQLRPPDAFMLFNSGSSFPICRYLTALNIIRCWPSYPLC